MCHFPPAAYQKAVREQRLAAEISAAKRERDFYLSRVDKAKAVAAQQERKRKVVLTKCNALASIQQGAMHLEHVLPFLYIK